MDLRGRDRVRQVARLSAMVLANSRSRRARTDVAMRRETPDNQLMTDTPLQEIVCCMGQPVAGNPTQFMMERAFAAAGLDWRYLTLEVPPDKLADAVRGIRAMGFRGGNFTIPHKVAVIEHLDSLSEAASIMGAVNCVCRDGDRLVGENTDGKGFLQSLRTLIDPAEQRIVILGAGGAARAIAVELAMARPTDLTIVNRGAERGEELARLLVDRLQRPPRFVPWQGDFEVPEGTQILINATSIGLGDAQARVPLNVKSLRSGHGRRRRDLQSAANPPAEGCRATRLPHARRTRHARQSRRDRLPALDRHRPGPASDARCVGGVFGSVKDEG